MRLKVKLNAQFRVEDIERDDKSPDWIERHKQTNQGKLPVLSGILANLCNEPDDSGHFHPFTNGHPISPGLQVIPVSGQQWQRMTSSERAQLLELVEWTGVNAEDYCREFHSHFPKDPDFHKRNGS